MQNPIVWFEIYVQDMPRAKTFYETVLQVELSSLADPTDTDNPIEMWAFPSDMDEHGASGALVKMDGIPPLKNGVGTIVYFQTEECGEVAERAVANGGSIFKEKMAIGEFGSIVLVNDTEGNLIGFHSM